MAITYDWVEKFYSAYLNSHYGEDIVWIDPDGNRSTIKAVVYREGVGSALLPNHRGMSSSKSRGIYLHISNSAKYGRVNIQLNAEKVEFNLNLTDTLPSVLKVLAIESTDPGKILLRLQN